MIRKQRNYEKRLCLRGCIVVISTINHCSWPLLRYLKERKTLVVKPFTPVCLQRDRTQPQPTNTPIRIIRCGHKSWEHRVKAVNERHLCVRNEDRPPQCLQYEWPKSEKILLHRLASVLFCNPLDQSDCMVRKIRNNDFKKSKNVVPYKIKRLQRSVLDEFFFLMHRNLMLYYEGS